VIIPVFKDGKLIFYTGRDMTEKKTKKYESPSAAKNKVLFGFDKLFENTDQPLYIVEGIFDAMLIDGVAILGNEISEVQAYWLNRSPREKVYIPDRVAGEKGALQAISYGWSVAFPDIGQAKDIGEGVETYGKLYVLTSIVQNTTNGLDAKLQTSLYCHDKKPTRKDYRRRGVA
jgi:DNA primase